MAKKQLRQALLSELNFNFFHVRLFHSTCAYNYNSSFLILIQRSSNNSHTEPNAHIDDIIIIIIIIISDMYTLFDKLFISILFIRVCCCVINNLTYTHLFSFSLSLSLTFFIHIFTELYKV
jgi:hypothetical protein